jgi:hypothetical protein
MEYDLIDCDTANSLKTAEKYDDHTATPVLHDVVPVIGAIRVLNGEVKTNNNRKRI